MKIWSPAEDEHLLAMDHMPLARVARRFNVSHEEITQRIAFLKKQMSEGVPVGEAVEAATSATDAIQETALPKGLTAQKIVSNLDEMQREFIEASAHFKALGGKLEAISSILTAKLAEQELVALVHDALKQPRKPGEKVEEKIAAYIIARCFVIARPPST